MLTDGFDCRVESACLEGEFGGKGPEGCVKVVVEEEEEEKEEGVGDGEELGAVEEELAGPAVGETSGGVGVGGRKKQVGLNSTENKTGNCPHSNVSMRFHCCC